MVTFDTESGERRIGALRDDLQTIVDLERGARLIGADAAPFANMIAMIEAGAAGKGGRRRSAGRSLSMPAVGWRTDVMHALPESWLPEVRF